MKNSHMENVENSHDEDDLLTLSLSCNPPKKARHCPPLQPMSPFTASREINNNNNVDVVDAVDVNAASSFSHPGHPGHTVSHRAHQAEERSRSRSRPLQRRAASQPAARQKSDQENRKIIPQPFPWATNRCATVHSRRYLLDNGILTVTGSMECKRCKTKFEMAFNFEDKFDEVWKFIQTNVNKMYTRAPPHWKTPNLPTCEHCGREKSVQPVLGDDTGNKNYNWLFLFLGQMLGCCPLRDLKHFLMHNNIHRTGSKRHVLYSTYITICKQLVPEWCHHLFAA